MNFLRYLFSLCLFTSFESTICVTVPYVPSGNTTVFVIVFFADLISVEFFSSVDFVPTSTYSNSKSPRFFIIKSKTVLSVEKSLE